MSAPTNTLNGLSLTVISEMALAALVARKPKLAAFTTDFSADVESKGAAVSTRIPTSVAPQDSTVAGYNPQNTTTTSKTVTLSNAINRTVGFNDKEASTITVDILKNTVLPTMVNDVVNSMVSGVFSNITISNFPLNISVSGLATTSFKGAAIASGVQVLNSGNVPEDNRWAVLAPVYYGALMNDTTISQAYALGSTSIIQDGKVNRLYGANMDYTNTINTAASTEGLKGFIATPDALLLAARLPAVPSNFPGDVANVVDADTSLGLQTRLWYDATAGTTNLSVGLIYGTSVGNSGSAVRFTDKQ